MSGAVPPRGLFPHDPADGIRNLRREGIRHVLDGAAWAQLAAELGGRLGQMRLLALWAEASGQVHALFHPDRTRPLIASVPTEAGRYLALSGPAPIAAPYERMVRDLHGFEAMHARDLRPMLDHGAWPATAPMAERPGPPPRGPEPPEWLPVEDETLSLVETGPVGALEGLLRTRLAMRGREIAAAEWAHGFGHRGLLAALQGRDTEDAAALAERLAAGATVAHAVAFARAVEQATATEIPPEAARIRAIAGEAERVAAFLATIGDVARAAGAERLAARAGALLSPWRDAMGAAFGHRLARLVVRPGGVARALGAEGAAALADAADSLRRSLAGFARLQATSLAPVLEGLAVVDGERAVRFGASGIVGRAAGQGFDARRLHPQAGVPVEASVAEEGCAATRLRLRLRGIEEAAVRLVALLAVAPDGPARVELGRARGEGIGCAEAPEGEAWHFVRLDAEGRVASAFLRDPSLPHALLAADVLRSTPLAQGGPPAAALRLSFGIAIEGLDL